MKNKKNPSEQLLHALFISGVIGLSALSTEGTSWAQKRTPSDPEGRIITLQNGNTKYEVKINKSNRSLKLRSLDPKTPSLIEPSITLYSSSGTFREVTLESEKPQQIGAPIQYSGKLDPSQESFVGLKLKFRLGTPATSKEQVLEWRSSEF